MISCICALTFGLKPRPAAKPLLSYLAILTGSGATPKERRAASDNSLLTTSTGGAGAGPRKGEQNDLPLDNAVDNR